LKQWPEGGPKVLWEVDTLGVGYSSVSVSNGVIYTQGDLKGVEHVIALKESDGSLLWATSPVALSGVNANPLTPVGQSIEITILLASFRLPVGLPEIIQHRNGYIKTHFER
jgi:hypothetical protein